MVKKFEQMIYESLSKGLNSFKFEIETGGVVSVAFPYSVDRGQLEAVTLCTKDCGEDYIQQFKEAVNNVLSSKKMKEIIEGLESPFEIFPYEKFNAYRYLQDIINNDVDETYERYWYSCREQYEIYEILHKQISHTDKMKTFEKVGEMLEEIMSDCYIRSGIGDENYDIDTPLDDVNIVIEPSEDGNAVSICGYAAGNYVDCDSYTYDESCDWERNQSVFMETYAKVFGIAAEYYMFNYGFGW